uniref:Uncharacterized protein n=1 Tax=Arundo donax TaxID=35708 RepID=A0A0A9B8Y3_ARUDO
MCSTRGPHHPIINLHMQFVDNYKCFIYRSWLVYQIWILKYFMVLNIVVGTD